MALKFRSEFDKKIFLTENRRLDLMSEDTIPDEICELFLKRRRSSVKNVLNFRKSQDAKANWRTNRFKIMKGIKSWHKSTEGKLFHRKLGRFLATRVIESYEVDKMETLKALSSLQTSLFTESDYFRYSLEEDADYYEFLDYSIPLLSSLSSKLFNEQYDSITKDELEIVFRLVDENCILSELSNVTGYKFGELCDQYKKTNTNLSLTHGLLTKFNEVYKMNKDQSLKNEETKNE